MKGHIMTRYLLTHGSIEGNGFTFMELDSKGQPRKSWNGKHQSGYGTQPQFPADAKIGDVVINGPRGGKGPFRRPLFGKHGIGKFNPSLLEKLRS